MRSKACSETDSISETDSTSCSVPGQRVFRWSKFVRNLYEMAITTENEKAVGFSDDGMCLEVRDPKLLSSEVLHKYFKHKNVSSFIRQLNNYGFKTIPLVMNSSVAHCFAHDCFRKDRIDLLEGVTRRAGHANDAVKIHEKMAAMKEREVEMELRVAQLKNVNEQLRRQNMELQEENKRLKSNWMSAQETSMKLNPYDQSQRRMQAVHFQDSFASFNGDAPSEMFMLPTIPALFPEEY